ncbi:MAG: MFS transporter [Dehalococcoidales bacterium]|nr:MFS transporter [Dehalococcoidales bacterium]
MIETGSQGGRWYAFSLGSAIVFFVFAAAVTAMPVLFAEIASELDLSILQVGTIWGASSAAGIFSILLAGFLADRYGVRRVLAVFCLAAGVFGASRGLSTDMPTLVVTSVLFGMAAEPVPVIVVKSVSQWFRGRGLGMAQGIMTASVGGGLMLGSALSATVLSPLLGGWNNVLYLYGGISVVLGIVWYLTVPEPLASPQTGSDIPLPSLRRAFGRVTRSRNVWLIAIAMMGFAGANKGVMGYLPLYLRNAGWTAVSADGALAALNAAGTAASVPFTLLSDRLGRRKTVLIPALFISIAGILLLTWVLGPAVWLLVILAGVFRDMVWAMAATMTVESEGIGPEYAGTAVGIVHGFTRLGYTFAPPAGNALEVISAGMPYAFWAGLCGLALLFFLFVPETGRGMKGHAAAPSGVLTRRKP